MSGLEKTTRSAGRSDDQAFAFPPRRIHLGDGRHGDDGTSAALPRRRRSCLRRPDIGGDRTPVLLAEYKAVAPGDRCRRLALAAASPGLCRDLPHVSDRRLAPAAIGIGFIDPADAARPDVSLHLALDRAGFGRLYLDRRRQCRCGPVRRLGVEPDRHGSDAGAAGLILHAPGGFSLDALRSIAFELLLPFLAGQALPGRIGGFVQRRRKMLGLVDRGSVLLMVYTVFSAATVNGLWHQLAQGRFALLVAVSAALLALMLAFTALAARRRGFARADE